MIALSRLRLGLSRLSAPNADLRATPAGVSLTLTLVFLIAALGVAIHAETSPGSFAGTLDEARSSLGVVIVDAYARAPALVMVLIALLIVPMTALLGLLIDTIWTRRRDRRSRADASPPIVTIATERPPMPVDTASPSPWPARAQLMLPGRTQAPFQLASHMTRIGRHEENDIRLPSASVHRYHAIIHQTPDAEFLITDLSGDRGNGVLVNGVRHDRRRLVNGDVITLGEVDIRFSSAPL